MVITRAALRNQVAIVFQHVQMVIVDNALDLFAEVIVSLGNAEIDRLALELFRLPIGRQIGDHPIADPWISYVEGAGCGVERSLGPIHPDAEAQALLVRRVRNSRKTMRKLLRVRVPIANAAEPAGIDVKHLQAQFLRFANHAQRQRLIHRHATAPTVVHRQRIMRVFPRKRVTEHCADPWTKLIARAVRAAGECTQKNGGRFKAPAGCKAGAEWTGIRIQAEHGLQAAAGMISRASSCFGCA